jgi:hypothetical protein
MENNHTIIDLTSSEALEVLPALEMLSMRGCSIPVAIRISSFVTEPTRQRGRPAGSRDSEETRQAKSLAQQRRFDPDTPEGLQNRQEIGKRVRESKQKRQAAVAV